jgi:brefeldin A-inhibited guanine nucleotide-exchange protein
MERDAYVTSLLNFSELNKQTELKIKNVLTIQTMLSIGRNYGNYLRKSWQYFLKCMSKLDDFHTMATGA